jgi:hypothetical protein
MKLQDVDLTKNHIITVSDLDSGLLKVYVVPNEFMESLEEENISVNMIYELESVYEKLKEFPTLDLNDEENIIHGFCTY